VTRQTTGRRSALIGIIAAAVACVVVCGLLIAAARLLGPSLFFPSIALNPSTSLEEKLDPEPEPLATSGAPLDQITILLPPYVPQPVTVTTAELEGLQVSAGTTATGTTVYVLTLGEESFNALMQRWLPAGGIVDERYRNMRLDLQPGGLILYAEVDVGIGWQQMGLLLLQEGTSLTPSGLVFGQEVYPLPEEGSLADALQQIGGTIDRVLGALTIVGPLPGEARVSQVRFHADRVELRAESEPSAALPPDTGWRTLIAGAELREIDVPAEGGTERLWVVRLDPAAVRFQVHYAPDAPRSVGEWGALLHPLLAINGGFFDEENRAIGLLVSDGQVQGSSLEDYAGMFAVSAGEQVSVRWLRAWPYDPHEPLSEALQSFPVLVKPGGVMGFPADADDGRPARRTVVAQDREGRILILVAPRGTLSLHELAVFLANADLNIDVALNLDGGSSTGLWLETTGMRVAVDSMTPVPSVLTVVRRSGDG
jgi:uncharacterized protein YigE (DUF2233 family)